LKTIEVRTVGTNVRGTIYLYASKKLSDLPAAANVAARHGIDLERLPRGLVVGTAELHDTRPTLPGDAEQTCVPRELLVGRIGWHFRNPQRLAEPLPVRFLPYGIWFYPFQRRSSGSSRPRH
jgi:hypothetical protein